MRSSFKAEDPDNVNFTLSVTMPLKEWKLLNGQLQSQWPSSRLSTEIYEMIGVAEQTFYPKPEPEKT